MVGFLGGAVPAMFAIMAFGFCRNQLATSGAGRAAIQGFLFFILSYVVYVFVRPMVELRYNKSGIYLYYFFHYNIFFLAWCLASYLLLYGSVATESVTQVCVRALSYFTGFFTLLALSDILLNHKSLNGYVLFLLPLARISLILISVAMIALMARIRHWLRYVLVAVPLAASAATSLAPLMVVQSRGVAALILSTAVFVLSVCGLFLSARN